MNTNRREEQNIIFYLQIKYMNRIRARKVAGGTHIDEKKRKKEIHTHTHTLYLINMEGIRALATQKGSWDPHVDERLVGAGNGQRALRGRQPCGLWGVGCKRKKKDRDVKECGSRFAN